MKKYILSLAIILIVGLQTKAQQDTLAQLHQPYQTAMGMLSNLQRTTPQDSVIINNEWQRLTTDYKRRSDSLLLDNEQLGIYFEAQRLMNEINYRKDDAKLQENRNTLYRFVNQHQAALLEDNTQFNKIAQCLMGIAPQGETNETKLIKYNASVIQDFYTQLDTATWSEQAHQQFLTAFAVAYLKIGSVRKAEKLYRHFDTFFVPTLSRKREHVKPLKTFSLPDSIHFKDGKFMTNGLIWSALKKGKVVIRLSEEPRMFDYVYLVSILRTINSSYADAYDVVILRNSDAVYDSYLSSIKRNLAFSDYNIATIPAEQWASFTQLPEVLVLNAQNKITDQATHTNPIFKKLNAPVEAKKEQEVAAYWADIDQKKDSIAQLAPQVKDSVSYQATHQNITFILKGLWDKDVTTQLSSVQWNATDIVRKKRSPYLAQLEVKHPQYTVYQLVVLVTGKKQEITIISGFNNQKGISFANAKNGKFHQAMQGVDRLIAQSSNDEYIIKNYPFQNSAFIQAQTQKQQATQAELKATIKGIKKRKVRKILERYKVQQIKNAKEMM